MGTVLIVIHLMVVIAMICMVLLQRSEGGALGIGGGGGFMNARGATNTLTRSTGILAAVFFATSVGLSILARYEDKSTNILNQAPEQTQKGNKEGGVLDLLSPEQNEEPPVSNEDNQVPVGN